MIAYVKHMQDKGLSASTTKTELSAIRLFHDQIPNARHTLPSNAELDLARRKFGGVDRCWSFEEFSGAVEVCRQLKKAHYEAAIKLGYFCGLRIEEVFKLDTAKAENAVRTGVLEVRGKNGLTRFVPIEDNIKAELSKMLAITTRGRKIFVGENQKTHLEIRKLQNFINYHRSKIQDENSTRPLHFHGLRHTAASRWYKELREKGLSDYAARKRVSVWLGHGRDDVCRIYLFSAKGGEGGV